MGTWHETHRAVVHPWYCDQFGHMNVRHYCNFFDDAGFHIWSHVGCPHSQMKARGAMLVVARNTIDFIHEMKAGELLRIETAFIRVGGKSCTHLSRMYNVDNGTLTATLESVEVFFDPVTRLSAPMPDDIRALLTDALVPLEDG